MEKHLRQEPHRIGPSRIKRLRGDFRAQYRLRVGDIRVFYRVEDDEVIVLGIPDPYRGEAAKAFIKLRPEAKPFSLDELRAQLAGKVGKHELPAAVEFVDDLPRTPVGKLSRHELRQQQKSSPGLRASGAPQ